MKDLTNHSINELSLRVMNDQSLVNLYNSTPFKFVNVLSKNFKVRKDQFETLFLDMSLTHPQSHKKRSIMSDYEYFKEQLELEALPIIEKELVTCK
jgi:hypothetical protein